MRLSGGSFQQCPGKGRGLATAQGTDGERKEGWRERGSVLTVVRPWCGRAGVTRLSMSRVLSRGVSCQGHIHRSGNQCDSLVDGAAAQSRGPPCPPQLQRCWAQLRAARGQQHAVPGLGSSAGSPAGAGTSLPLPPEPTRWDKQMAQEDGLLCVNIALPRKGKGREPGGGLTSLPPALQPLGLARE